MLIGSLSILEYAHLHPYQKVIKCVCEDQCPRVGDDGAAKDHTAEINVPELVPETGTMMQEACWLGGWFKLICCCISCEDLSYD